MVIVQRVSQKCLLYKLMADSVCKMKHFACSSTSCSYISIVTFHFAVANSHRLSGLVDCGESQRLVADHLLDVEPEISPRRPPLFHRQHPLPTVTVDLAYEDGPKTPKHRRLGRQQQR